MAKGRELVGRIKTTENTRKITRTMELIATARFKKAMSAADEAAILRKKLADATKKVADADTATIVEKAANSNGHAAEGLAH